MKKGKGGGRRLAALLILFLSLLPWAACKWEGKKELTEGENVLVPARMEALEGEDSVRAKERALSCIARVDIRGEAAEYYGSGLLWDFCDDRLILVTAGHLLDQGEVLRIVFPNGEEAEAEGWKRSRLYDVGFVEVDWESRFGGGEALVMAPDAEEGDFEGVTTGGESRAGDGTGTASPALVSLHQRIFETLDSYSVFFLLASGEEGAGDLETDLVLKEKELYREEFGSQVMLFSGRSHAGMSGGGVFDGCGHLAGMAVGGRGDETAALSMETLNAAYGEVYARRVDTQEYGKKEG